MFDHAPWQPWLLRLFAGGAAIGLLYARITSRRRQIAAAPKTPTTRINPERHQTMRQEHRDTLVTLQDDVVTVQYPKRAIETFDLRELRWVTLYVENFAGMPLRTLRLRKHRYITVPVLAQCYEALRERLQAYRNFDHKAYAAGIASKEMCSRGIPVLRLPWPVNAMLLHEHTAEELRASFGSGFALESSKGTAHFTVDDTVEQIMRLRGVTVQLDDFNRYSFVLPRMRFGDLELNGLLCSVPIGPSNRPLAVLTMALSMRSDDSDYWTLRKYFASFLGEGTGWERADSNSWRWTSDGITVSLNYWYEADYSNESGYTSFTIKNERQYAQYLIDRATDGVELTDVDLITLPILHGMPTRDFRRSSWVRRTPPVVQAQLTSEESYAIWADRKNNCIGFAQGDAALIVPRAETTGISILNATPGRGGGYSDLRVLEAGDDASHWAGISAGQADFGEWPRYQQQIEQLLGFVIHVETFISD